MLPRSQRLPTRLFKSVMEKGRITHSPPFLLSSIPGSDGRTRISAVVPVKVAKKAADRNRLRRRIYAAIAPLYPSIAGAHAIVFAKSLALKADPDEIGAAIRAVFVKAGLLK